MTQIVRFMAFGTGRIGRASTCSPPLVTRAARRRCDWCRYRHELRDLDFATEPTVPRWVSARIENDTLLIDTSDDSDAEINTALVHAGLEFGPQVKHFPTPDVASKYFVQSCFGIWAFLMLPLFVTPESALLADIEHGNQQWKHLLALPLPRYAHYFAKVLALCTLVVLATAVLALALIPSAGLVLAAFGVGGLAGVGPFAHMLELGAKTFAAAMLIVALHTWVAVRWRSFPVAVSMGISATVMGFLIGQSAQYGRYSPWTMPLQALVPSGAHPTALACSLAGAVFATLLGLRDFARREFD
jgi:hypothetical protein